MDDTKNQMLFQSRAFDSITCYARQLVCQSVHQLVTLLWRYQAVFTSLLLPKSFVDVFYHCSYSLTVVLPTRTRIRICSMLVSLYSSLSSSPFLRITVRIYFVIYNNLLLGSFSRQFVCLVAHIVLCTLVRWFGPSVLFVQHFIQCFLGFRLLLFSFAYYPHSPRLGFPF